MTSGNPREALEEEVSETEEKGAPPRQLVRTKDNDDGVAAMDTAEVLEEREKDEPVVEARAPPRVNHVVGLNDHDATPDVFFSSGGQVLSSLAQGGFKHLTSGVRANTGAKDGRYFFELRILERVPQAQPDLRVGFSTAGSSLFLGDGTADSISFNTEGTYFAAEPDGLAAPEVPKACKRMPPQKVIGVLVNQCKDSPNANTVSVFHDGVRAGVPQPIPPHLRGKALYPTITFRNLTLAVNFGKAARRLAALPFSCRGFAEMNEAHHEVSGRQASSDRICQVVVPVGLPGGGFYDFVDRYLEEHPNFVELSDRTIMDWSHKSGLVTKRECPSATNSRDRPDFPSQLDGKATRAMLRMLAQLTGRSCIVAEQRAALLKEDREELLSKFPKSAKKIAVVVMGEPDAAHREWVHGRIRSDYETKKALVERRKTLAEASGETLSEDLPLQPVLDDSVKSLPRADDILDIADSAFGNAYARFSLPTELEGFDQVDHAWFSREASQEQLTKWIMQRKVTQVVEGLQPGEWFKSQVKQWHELRKMLQRRHGEHVVKMRKAKADGEEIEDVAGSVDLSGVTDIHDADGAGTPVYANFKYEDWILLGWRYELHLLTHAFACDVDDPDRPGMPEAHVPHYYEVYFTQKLDPGKINASNFTKALKVLKEPLEVVDEHGKYLALRSKLGRETTVEAFVKDIEVYRRDRIRRIDAGDESARLAFPKPQKSAAGAPKGTGDAVGAPAKAAVAKVAQSPGAGVAARVALAPAGPKGGVVIAKAPRLVAPPVAAGVKRPPSAVQGVAVAKRPRPQ